MIDEIIIHVFVLKQIENDHTQWKEKDIYPTQLYTQEHSDQLISYEDRGTQ